MREEFEKAVIGNIEVLNNTYEDVQVGSLVIHGCTWNGWKNVYEDKQFVGRIYINKDGTIELEKFFSNLDMNRARNFLRKLCSEGFKYDAYKSGNDPFSQYAFNTSLNSVLELVEKAKYKTVTCGWTIYIVTEKDYRDEILGVYENSWGAISMFTMTFYDIILERLKSPEYSSAEDIGIISTNIYTANREIRHATQSSL